MRHVTAHISIWSKLGWIGIICYFVFAAAAPEVLTVGLACVIASCWDPDPESVEDEVELDPDLARSLQAMG